MSMYRLHFGRAITAALLGSAVLMSSAFADEGKNSAKVTLMRVPHGGIQPQCAVDAKGVLHLIYFKGEPGAGDVFYVRSDDGGAKFTEPIRVNSKPGSV